ncbi:hypothetical protein [Streptomyces sp. NPDC053542]|uniref:hypothetical protein n=1 Tax=Streptomyces sp. NPDC053542 TaxID=3365710 RepID=UPI0037D257C4
MTSAGIGFIGSGSTGAVAATSSRSALSCGYLPASARSSATVILAALSRFHSAPGGLPLVRRVALAWVQMRRRTVFTHVLATEPMPRKDVEQLTYRAPRAEVRVLPTLQGIDKLTLKGRLRTLVGLQALATGETAYIEGDVVRTAAPPGLMRR